MQDPAASPSRHTAPMPDARGKPAVSGVEQIDPDLGSRLRLLRKQSGTSLRDLASRLSISASALSQIENGRMQPSVSRLISIVTALDVPLAFVFGQPDVATGTARLDAPVTGVSVARAGEIERIVLSTGVLYERLTPTPVPGIELFKSTYPPSSQSSPAGEYLTHSGFETGYMLSGSVMVEYEGASHTLHCGDSISHLASQAHRIVNPSDDLSAEMIWLTVR